MKRYGNLFNQTFSEENMYAAYMDARKGKRQKKACFEFELNLGANLKMLREQILGGTYRPAPYFNFMVYEPKPRLIYAPAFEDTVVQHAIYRVIYPIFDRTFISTSFACRKGYGTHAASRYLQKALWASHPDSYTLKLDVRKFFYSIDRGILRILVEKKIKDSRLVDVMMLFAGMDTDKGIPIGNLLSQIYALIYLNPVDHFAKRNIKAHWYVRYVDDMVFVGVTRAQCLEYRERIVEFLQSNLDLVLSKSTIQKVRHGVNFVGYRTWRSKKFIRKYSLYKFFRKAKRENIQSINSILGHAKQSDSLAYMLAWLRRTNPVLLNQLPSQYGRTAACL
jgi:RNA-directed DNA polymerase